jgi:hypothetical protein
VHESGQQARGFLGCGDVGNLAVQLVGDHGDAQGGDVAAVLDLLAVAGRISQFST